MMICGPFELLPGAVGKEDYWWKGVLENHQRRRKGKVRWLESLQMEIGGFIERKRVSKQKDLWGQSLCKEWGSNLGHWAAGVLAVTLKERTGHIWEFQLMYHYFICYHEGLLKRRTWFAPDWELVLQRGGERGASERPLQVPEENSEEDDFCWMDGHWTFPKRL